VRFYTDGPSAPCCASLAAIRASAAPALALASPKVSRAPATSPSSPTGGDHCRVQTEEEIADRRAPAVSDPALRQMVRTIVQHVAALAERAEILWPIVGRIAVQVRRREHDARHPKPSRLHKVGPAGGPSSAIPPNRRLLVEPAPVRQAPKEDEVRPAAALAPSSSALEADAAAQLAPVRGIERSQLRADWHRLESR